MSLGSGPGPLPPTPSRKGRGSIAIPHSPSPCGRGLGGGGRAASEPLRQFLQAARSAGIRVSAAEGIDAARAVQVVGYSDRTVLKDTLSLVLAKTPDEKNLFDECFDLYFRRDSLAPDDDDATDLQTPTMQAGFGGEGTGGGGGRSLSQMLLDDDRAALATAMEEAAREVRHPEHPLLHPEEPLRPPHPRPHGPAPGRARHGGAAQGRPAGHRRPAGEPHRGAARPGARPGRAQSAAVRPRRDGEVPRGTAEVRAPLQPGTPRPGADAHAGARDGEAPGRALRQDAAAPAARAPRCAADTAEEHGLGRHSRSSPCGSRSASRSRA